MISNRLVQQKGLVNKKNLSSNLAKLAYTILLLFLGYSLSKSVLLLRGAQIDLKFAQNSLSDEQKVLTENQNTLTEISKNSYIEKVARNTLGLARPDELVLVLPDNEAIKKLSPRVFEAKEEESRTKIPNFQKWLQLLF